MRWRACVQIAAAEAAAKAEAQELEGWKRDATAVLAALETTHTEKIAEVISHAYFELAKQCRSTHLLH